jgi:hypothetical protein
MSKSSLFVSLLSVLFLFVSSCATLIHGGGQQTISIATDPPDARIQVGGQSLVSPAEITLSRDHDYQVVATKEGYDTAITSIHSRFSWVTVLDLVFIIPWVIDLASGSAYYLDPTTMQLAMSPTNLQPRSVGSSDSSLHTPTFQAAAAAPAPAAPAPAISRAAALASDQATTGSKPVVPAPTLIPAAAVVIPAASPIIPAPAATNPAVGDQWKSTDHPE